MTALSTAFDAALENLRDDEALTREEADTDRIADLETKVDDAQAALLQFQGETGLVSLDQFAGRITALDQLKQNERDRRVRVAESGAATSRLSSSLSISLSQARRAMQLKADPEFQGLLERYATATGERSERSGTLGDGHGAMEELAAERAALEADMAARGSQLTGLPRDRVLAFADLAVSNTRENLFASLTERDSNHAGNGAALAELRRQISQQSATAELQVEQAARLADLMRDLRVAEAVFSSALAQLDTNKSDPFASYPLVQTLEAPSLPRNTSAPSPLIVLAGALAASIIKLTIESTWLLWLVGGLYIVGPVLGWLLAGMVALAFYLGALPDDQGKPNKVPTAIWIWIAAMIVMLVVLWIGHSNYALGIAKTIKSSIGWAKGWALIAVFPLAGAALKIRPEVIYRAFCKLGVYTIALLPLFLLAPIIGLPELLYVSPLKVLGGAGDDYFAVQLYTIEPGVGTARWQFFAPWSPAGGMMGVITVLLSWREKHIGWRSIGVAGGLTLAIFSQSRLALVALAVIAPIVWSVARLDRGWMWLLATPVILALGMFGPILVEIADSAMNDFSSARADSSRVRATLGRIAIDRWQTEAFWFGHGVVENGPHLVEYMPIGSHHSWYGLLFVKGIVGLIALATPLLATFWILVRKSMQTEIARCGLAMVLVLVLYSFGENLEILAYLYWPALVIIGVALSAQPSDKNTDHLQSG